MKIVSDSEVGGTAVLELRTSTATLERCGERPSSGSPPARRYLLGKDLAEVSGFVAVLF